MSKIWDFLKNKGRPLLELLIFLVVAGYFFWTDPLQPKSNPVLKDYKDGIQNHLTWDIKGQCFFVRPNDDVTVYLIRVTDCDKK